ncbi:MAG TPA: ASKHA domain-containing protein [Clostridia bacterium]|nr:ASKHA domain-containing protein [Clostridia bacterium]
MQLEIRTENGLDAVELSKGENLLDVLTRLGYDVNAVCGGNGSCYKCKVRVIKPFIKPVPRELTALSAEEINRGIRLACGVTLEEDTEIEILRNEKMQVLASASVKEHKTEKKGKVHAAVDIGTTTVVVALIDEKAAVIGSIGEKNKQAAFGADVIARIKAVVNGQLEQLQSVIIKQINAMLKELTVLHDVGEITDITIAGNTAMLHLFFGKDCSGLGHFPYEADFLASQTANGLVLGFNFDVPVHSLPCIASFAGADLTAGIVSQWRETKKYTLLIDLGTNAEIALFNGSKVFVSSAAAGPAFEGASIKQGMGAVPGAICSYELVNGNGRVRTIGNKLPVGICGSGLIDIVAELLKNNLLEDTGFLRTGKSFELCEEVSIFAQDIRELQLAKAAIAAAIDMLIITAGLTPEDIDRVLISGGFGSYINPGNAALIGLFPAELREKTAAAGNSSLAGCIQCAAFSQKKALAEKIAANAKYLDLASSVEFAQRYVDHMMF